MGKKGNKRKTRWRVLPIGGEDFSGAGSNNEDEAEERDSLSPTSHNGSYARAAHQQRTLRGGRTRGGGGGYQSPYYKHRPYHSHHHYDNGQPLVTTEKKTFNEEEYTKITTPRQDVLFKKGYLGRKRPTVPAETASQATADLAVNGNSEDLGGHNGESVDNDHSMVDSSEILNPEELPPFVYNAYVDQNGMYYINGSYEFYDPYSGNVTVVVGPAPHYAGPSGGPPVLAAVPCQPLPLQPLEWFNPAFLPYVTAPVHNGMPRDRRKRYSTDSQNCSAQSSESTGPPGSPQECEETVVDPQGSCSVYQPQPPSYMYPGYMFGPPVYDMNGVTVQSAAPPQVPVSDVGAKRRKKKRRRRKRRGGAEDGSEESSSEEKELEEPMSLTSQESSSQELESDSKQSTVSRSEEIPLSSTGNREQAITATSVQDSGSLGFNEDGDVSKHHDVQLNCLSTDHSDVQLNCLSTDHSDVQLNCLSTDHSDVQLNCLSTDHSDVQLNGDGTECNALTSDESQFEVKVNGFNSDLSPNIGSDNGVNDELSPKVTENNQDSPKKEDLHSKQNVKNKKGKSNICNGTLKSQKVPKEFQPKIVQNVDVKLHNNKKENFTIKMEGIETSGEKPQETDVGAVKLAEMATKPARKDRPQQSRTPDMTEAPPVSLRLGPPKPILKKSTSEQLPNESISSKTKVTTATAKDNIPQKEERKVISHKSQLCKTLNDADISLKPNAKKRITKSVKCHEAETIVLSYSVDELGNVATEAAECLGTPVPPPRRKKQHLAETTGSSPDTSTDDSSTSSLASEDSVIDLLSSTPTSPDAELKTPSSEEDDVIYKGKQSLSTKIGDGDKESSCILTCESSVSQYVEPKPLSGTDVDLPPLEVTGPGVTPVRELRGTISVIIQKPVAKEEMSVKVRARIVSQDVAVKFADRLSCNIMEEALQEVSERKAANSYPITEAVTRWLRSQSPEEVLTLPLHNDSESDLDDDGLQEEEPMDDALVNEGVTSRTGQKNVHRNPLPALSLENSVDGGRRVANNSGSEKESQGTKNEDNVRFIRTDNIQGLHKKAEQFYHKKCVENNFDKNDLSTITLHMKSGDEDLSQRSGMILEVGSDCEEAEWDPWDCTPLIPSPPPLVPTSSPTDDLLYMCDPALSVAKYYRFGPQPTTTSDSDSDSDLQHFHDETELSSPNQPLPAHWAIDMIVTEKSYGNHEIYRRRYGQQTARPILQSAILVGNLKGQVPFPCGGICCILQ